MPVSCASVTTTERSPANIGWSGSIARRTPRSAAYGMTAAMPSSTMPRAASISRSGAGPHTSTSTSVPISAASSSARRLSSIRSRRALGVAAGKNPPRHRLDTRRPASRINRALATAPPASATLSRHGPIHGMPARKQPSTASRSVQRWVVAWLRLSRTRSGGRTSVNASHRQDRTHTRLRLIRVAQQAGAIHQAEDPCQMNDGPRALLAADHRKVVLVPIEVGKKHDACLVKAGRRTEDVAREGDCRRQDGVVHCQVATIEGRQGGRGGRSDRIEYPEQRVRAPAFITADQRRIVEVVAGVHAHTGGQAAAQGHLMLLVEQRDLDTVHLVGVLLYEPQADLSRLVQIERTPVSDQCRIEHFPQPVENHRLTALRKDAIVDPGVIVWPARAGDQSTAGHQNDASTVLLHERALLLVGGDDVLERHAHGWGQMVRARAARDAIHGANRARLG